MSEKPTRENASGSANDAPDVLTLALAYVWSELRGQGWKLFAFPLVAGLVIAGGIGVASVTTLPLDAELTQLLQDAAGQYFTQVPDEGNLLTALIVIQGPSTVTMLAALMSLIMVQTGLGKRLAVGEFELLLSGPYRDREVFLALVVGAFILSLIGIGIILVLSMGVGLGILLTEGVQLSSDGIALFTIGLIAPIPMALWATFVAVVTFLIFPEAAMNNSHPGNLIPMVAILPAIGVLLATTAGIGVDAFVIVASANLFPLLGMLIGWITVRWWFRVEKVL